MTTMAEYEGFVRLMGTKDGVFMPLEIVALGLCGETMEWRLTNNPADWLLELGDVLFYATAMAIHLEQRIPEPIFDADEEYQVSLTRRSCEMADKIKKITWHNREDLRVSLSLQLDDFFFELQRAAGDGGYALEQVADANVAKLKARWPSGFRPT